MPELFVEAANNNVEVQRRYDEASGTFENAQRLADFRADVRSGGRVSINMRPNVVSAILIKGQYKNIYKQAEDLAEISGRTVDAELRRLLGGYFDRRIAFDKTLEIPNTAFYAAVNLGGLGASIYGSFCIILNGLAISFNRTVYIASDSLKDFVSDDANVDLGSLLANCCSGDALPELCSLKHAYDPLMADPLNWGKMACNDNTYVEAIVDDEFTPSSISEIRIARDEYDELMRLALGGFYDKPKGNAERALAQDFLEILSQAAAYSISITTLDA